MSRGEQLARCDEPVARGFRWLWGHESGHENASLGDLDRLAGLDPSQIPACVLPEFPHADTQHGR